MHRKRELCEPVADLRDCKRTKADSEPPFVPARAKTHDLPHHMENSQCVSVSLRSNFHRWESFDLRLQAIGHAAAPTNKGRVVFGAHSPTLPHFENFCPGCLMPLRPPDFLRRSSVFVSSCQKSFESLSDAVRNACEGDTILLEPGIYIENEAVVLDKTNLSIQAKDFDATADGRDVHIVSHTFEQHCFVIRADGCRVVGLDVLHMSCQEERGGKANIGKSLSAGPLDQASQHGCFSIEAGSGCVEHCIISSMSGYGVMVWADASPAVRSCAIQHCAQAAVICGGTSEGNFTDNSLVLNKSFGFVVVDEAAGLVEGNTVLQTAKCGVLCAGQSRTVFRNNAILDGSQGGMWIRNSSAVHITGNSIRGNAKAGLQVGDESNPLVENNALLDGKNGGIVIHGSARGYFVGNTLAGHAQAGVGVQDEAAPVLVRNTLERNAAGGAIMAGRSKSVWHHNTVTRNAVVGVGLKEAASARLVGDSVEGNDGPGVLLQANCHLTLQDCTVSANAKAEVICAGASQLVATGTTLNAEAAEDTVGVQCMESARARLCQCGLRGHAGGNLVLQDSAEARATQCVVAESAWAGVVLQGGSQATLRRCAVVGNNTGLLAMEDAAWCAESSAFSDSRGVGVMAAGASRGTFSHNNCVGNGGAGLVARGAAEVAVLHNRVSGNGGDGIVVDDSCRAVIAGNCSYDNAGGALHLGGTCHADVVGNVLGSGTGAGPAGVASRIQGACDGTAVRNLVESFELDSDDAQFAFADNVTACPAKTRKAVWHALEAGLVGPKVNMKQVPVAVEVVGGGLVLGVGAAEAS